MRKDQLGVLPGMFRALPSQAIECCLWGGGGQGEHGQGEVLQGAGGERQHVWGGLWPS